MILVFDGVSTRGYLGIFSPDRQMIAHKYFEIAGNESSQAGNILFEFLDSEQISLSDITDIVCVIGPGSFTGVRTITLMINTLAYIYPHLRLTGISFFDLYGSYPQVKSSSKRDLFVKWKKGDIINVLSNEAFQKECTQNTIYGDINDTRFGNAFNLKSEVHYEKLVQNLELGSLSRLAPLYVKKPNIS